MKKKLGFTISLKADQKNIYSQIQERAERAGVSVSLYTRMLLIAGLKDNITISPKKESQNKTMTVWLRRDQAWVYDALERGAKEANVHIFVYSRLLLEAILDRREVLSSKELLRK